MLTIPFIRSSSATLVALVLAGPVVAAQVTTGPGGRQAAKQRRPQTPIAAIQAPVATAMASSDTTTSATPAAPQLVQLKGLVLNPDGRPRAGASVFPAGAPRQLVVTDAKGTFVLPVPAGTALSLQVEYFGVGSSRVTVEKPSAEPLRITLGK